MTLNKNYELTKKNMFEDLKNIKPTESALVMSAPFSIRHFTVSQFPFSAASFNGVCPYYKKDKTKIQPWLILY